VLKIVLLYQIHMLIDILIYVWIIVQQVINMLWMLLVSVQVYVHKDYIWRILRRNVRQVVIQAMLKIRHDFVLLDVLVIHKHLHMLVIKYVCMNVRQIHKIYMQIIKQISVLHMIIVQEMHQLQNIQIQYQEIVFNFVHKACIHKIAHLHALVIAIQDSQIILPEVVLMYALNYNKLTVILAPIHV
jgi:hypothetical protein